MCVRRPPSSRFQAHLNSVCTPVVLPDAASKAGLDSIANVGAGAFARHGIRLYSLNLALYESEMSLGAFGDLESVNHLAAMCARRRVLCSPAHCACAQVLRPHLLTHTLHALKMTRHGCRGAGPTPTTRRKRVIRETLQRYSHTSRTTAHSGLPARS